MSKYFGKIRYVRRVIPVRRPIIPLGSSKTTDYFGFFRYVNHDNCVGRLAKSVESDDKSNHFGFFLYVRPETPPGCADRRLGRTELVKRFGFFRRIHAIILTRSLAMILVNGLKALANPTRLRVLELLKNPTTFDGPRGADGRPVGLTAKALLKHLRCAQPTLSEQMQVLAELGLVESRKVGRWVVYTRDEERIRQLKQTIIEQLLPAE